MINEFFTRPDFTLSEFTKDESFPFFIQYGGHDTVLSLHGHEDFTELVIVLSGSARHVVGNERFDIGKGDVFCIGSGIKHGYENVRRFRICNIMFRPEAVLNAQSDVKTLAGFHALFVVEPRLSDGFRSSMRLGGEAFSALGQLAAKTIEEYNAQRPARKTLLLAYFNEIVVLLSRLYSASGSSEKTDSVAAAAALMESRFAERDCMEKVISALHYSERHFVRLFSAAYGITPAKYLADIRMRKAAALLKCTGLSVAEISLQCGFPDPNYFSRAYKKMFGVSPSESRK